LDAPVSQSQSVAMEAQQVRFVAGRERVFDAEGFLLDPYEWTEEVAMDLARESGVAALTDLQWQVLRFLRAYYLQNGRAPLNRQIKSGTGLSLMEIENLFPGGIKQGARQLAGLPNPRSCGS
jgi:TusE/DsrC/DsvC family sulfur relay protein